MQMSNKTSKKQGKLQKAFRRDVQAISRAQKFSRSGHSGRGMVAKRFVKQLASRQDRKFAKKELRELEFFNDLESVVDQQSLLVFKEELYQSLVDQYDEVMEQLYLMYLSEDYDDDGYYADLWYHDYHNLEAKKKELEDQFADLDFLTL